MSRETNASTMLDGPQATNQKGYPGQKAARIDERILTIREPWRKIDEKALKNNIRIRQLILEKPVESIGKQAFSNCTSLRQVQFHCLKKIGAEAFLGCTKLEEVQIPSSVLWLGKKAFFECKGLQRVEFAHGSCMKQLPAAVFGECSHLQEVLLPEGIVSIGDRAFYRCKELERMTLPPGLLQIGREAFYQTNLRELALPSSLEEIGDSAFLKCNRLEYVCLPPGVKHLGKWVFHGCNRLKVLEIRHDPETVGDWLINRSACIRCRKGSRMEEYCSRFGFRVEYLDEPN